MPDDENGYCLSLRDSIGGDVNWEAIHLSLCCGDRNFSVADRSLGGVLRVDDGAPEDASDSAEAAAPWRQADEATESWESAASTATPHCAS